MSIAVRLRRLRAYLQGERIDGCLVTAPVALRYFTGFVGSTGLLLILPRTATLFLDARYLEKGKTEVRGVTVAPLVSWQDVLHRAVAQAGRTLTVAFDEGDTTALQARRWREAFPEVLWHSRNVAFAPLRAVKDRTEQALLREAGRRLARAFAEVRAQFAVGKSEREMALLLDAAILRHTGAPPAFETMVASGPHAARPHHNPTDRKLRRGEPLLIDCGASWQGYIVDMTRMLALSPLPAPVRRAWRAVAQAQAAAKKICRAGRPVNDLDRAVRAVLKRHRLEPFFTHNLGHGVGLKIHEEPVVNGRTPLRLQAGMAITIEPGVYFPEKFGIRLEDTVLVTARGCETLTTAPLERV